MGKRYEYPIQIGNYYEEYYVVLIPPKRYILKGIRKRIADFLENYRDYFWNVFTELKEKLALDPVQALYFDEAGEILEELVEEIKAGWSHDDGSAYFLSTRSDPEGLLIDILQKTVIGEFMKPIDQCRVVIVEELPNTVVAE